jgi:hypothetical protein
MGGRVFKGTTPVYKQAVDHTVNSFNLLLTTMKTQLHVIGSCYQMSDNATTGDIDSLISERAICSHFGVKTGKEARRCLRNYLENLGFETAQSGASVHVKVPYKTQFHQLDMMLVDFPQQLAVFHRHQIPQNSTYKGFHKQMALFWLAKQHGLCWSAFQGLYTRDTQGHRSNLLAIDANYVAWILLGDTATAKDLLSFESICNALEPVAREKMTSGLLADPSWKKYNEIH